MTREWKPGDVAMVTIYGAEHIAFRALGGWVNQSCSRFNELGPIESLRPLVVIDSEDGEQVERLVQAYYNHPNRIEQRSRESSVNHMQAALREFANPTPPKPDEPMGLGAVVEGVNGERWTRIDSTSDADFVWICEADDVVAPFCWDNLDVVRVLSEGVQP